MEKHCCKTHIKDHKPTVFSFNGGLSPITCPYYSAITLKIIKYCVPRTPRTLLGQLADMEEYITHLKAGETSLDGGETWQGRDDIHPDRGQILQLAA